ncbi:uncharacterized protein LOC120010450 [Tripterygium wilfordii]|uniref:uncharacterized protein LOC120010450 n=1 Tax=Tripterygium wilfordii TaxID=458696 RepID=UPI0018F7FB68|nr:uncharacterized protein LOC120010450 [Tripterygium wilfordii]
MGRRFSYKETEIFLRLAFHIPISFSVIAVIHWVKLNGSSQSGHFDQFLRLSTPATCNSATLSHEALTRVNAAAAPRAAKRATEVAKSAVMLTYLGVLTILEDWHEELEFKRLRQLIFLVNQQFKFCFSLQGILEQKLQHFCKIHTNLCVPWRKYVLLGPGLCDPAKMQMVNVQQQQQNETILLAREGGSRWTDAW